MVAAPWSEAEHEGASAHEARSVQIRELAAVHYAHVWKFVRRLGVPAALADEVVQDVFLVALRRADAVRAGSERAFLFATAFRTARHALNKARREPATDDPDQAPTLAPDPEETLDKKQTRELAYSLLAELDDDLRGPFVMFELEGMTMQEIASVMGLPVPTVGSRLRRAREAFRACAHRRRSRLRGDL